jgi:transcriptional regulator MraZ
MLNAIPYGDVAGRAFARTFYADTVGPLVPDGQGRIPIPAHLLRLAGLTKDAKFLPMGDRIEIWDPVRYQERHEADDETMVKGAERYFGGAKT